MDPGFEGILATDENMPFILMAMEAADDLAVDTETTGVDVRNGVDYCMGICIDTGDVACYIPFRHKEGNVALRWIEPIAAILRVKPLLWHNRKFDMHSLKTLGIDPLSFMGSQTCSMVLASLVDEELFSKELDFLAKRFLREEKADEEGVIHKFWEIYGPVNTPAYMYRQYGSWDARLTRRLVNYFWAKIIEQELTSVYRDTEEPFTALLYLLEQRGVGVNHDLAAEKARIGRGRMATIYRELGFNPASPTDLKRILLDELKLPILAHTDSCDKCGKKVKYKEPVETHDGPPSFNKAAMEDYDDILSESDNPLAKRITEYRGWQKATTALYEPLLEKVGPDGRVRTEFHQHRTVTGRQSSSDPNLHQIPRSTSKPWNGDAKACFNSGLGDDWALYGWDYSQIELRLAAAYGHEELLLAEFEREGADPFALYAPLIFGHLDSDTRHYTKNGFFYPKLYGAGIRKIVAVLNKPEPEVRALLDRFESTIPGVIAISNQVARLIEQRGYIKYWDGRRRHIKDRSKSYKGFNAVCQGGAAQLLKKAMLRCLEFEDPEKYFMVLSVHDEITWCVRRDCIAELEVLVTEAMTDWPDFGVNLVVEGKEWK